MRLEGRKLILEEKINKDTDCIVIKNIDSNYIYEIVYNNLKYSPSIIDNSICFKLPNKNKENTLYLKVSNIKNQYLYSTNVVTLAVEDIEDLKNEIINKYLNLENMFNVSIKNLSNKNNVILNEIKEIYNNLNYDSDILAIKNDILNNNLEYTNMINKLEKNISEIKNNYSSNIEVYDDTYLTNKILDNEKFCIELEKDLKKLNQLYTEIDYQNQINDILKKINEIDINICERENINKDIIDELKKNINTKVNDVDILNLKNFVKLHSHEEIQNNIKLQEGRINEINLKIQKTERDIYNKLKLEYDNLLNKYNDILEKYKELKKNKNTFLPINIGNKIEPFKFINSKNGNIEKYSYSAYRSPIGVSDEYGNVIIKGLAKVEYINDIFEGDFVYGNKDGVAEHYDKGYVVSKIIDKNYCEIIL